jgi:hypothetical protein
MRRNEYPQYFKYPQGRIDYALLKLDYFRKNQYITKILGFKHKTNHKMIELNITYDCNLKCYNCCNSCRQAPTFGNLNMSVRQIEKFIIESIEKRMKWKQIRLMGGEPTLHPYLIDILELLLKYRTNNSIGTKIQLSTNGFGPTVKKVLSNIPKGIEIINDNKKSQIQPNFLSINIAPKDMTGYESCDFRNGCWVTSIMGLGLSSSGYYQCVVGAGIDRVFGFDIGRMNLPSNSDKLIDQKSILCRYCGLFKNTDRVAGGKQKMSKSWKDSYDKYQTRPPSLSVYK